ncbi:hypothetical protein GCM10007913_37620 [Devosia yakushimensis]|uniref:Cytochrome c oxidase subunit IV bacterial aa3 type domain-containing protein n=1 Tax=Devosia yakushimensis TaxID=470028 RepID=A0ABQ5UKX3_9HYPH|nr:aa3-type cytochrome c oxidase subunit IV [Devosia yakushimensis]GLQ11830.1 hypothetical protein GCM10007913_37620 [Devosia yakushimensis]
MAASKHEPLPPLREESPMDYAQHEATYSGFVTVTKYTILGIAIMMVGLYFAIIADQPVLGLVLILASFVVPPIMGILSKK